MLQIEQLSCSLCCLQFTAKMTTDEKTYYIDETVGEDSQSTAGTAEKPFKTVSFAFLQHSEAQYLVRDGDEWKSGTLHLANCEEYLLTAFS